jgi:hypothetical protein
MNENLTIIVAENFPRTLTSENNIEAVPITVNQVKKRKGERGEGTKAYQKEMSKIFKSN